MAKQTKIDTFILDYSNQNGIKLLIDPNLDKNDGLCYPDIKEIHLSEKYSSAKVKLACFFHEVSHIRVERFKNKPYSIFDCEFFSWSEAIRLHRKHFGKSFNKAQAEFMLKCLKTYCRSHYEFRKAPESEED